MAIAKGLQGVASVAAQVEKGNRQEDDFKLKLAENREKNEAINAYNDKNLWRLKFEQEVKKNNNPEDYLDALRAGEEEYDSAMLSGKSEVFRNNFLQYDRIAQFNALGRMSTDMERDIFKKEQADTELSISKMVEAGDIQGLQILRGDLVGGGIYDANAANAMIDAGIKQIRINGIESMPPMDRINMLQSIKKNGKESELGIDADQMIRNALTERDTQMKIDAMKDNANIQMVYDDLGDIIRDPEKTRLDAMAYIDSLGWNKDSAPHLDLMRFINGKYGGEDNGKVSGAAKRNMDRSVEQASAVLDKIISGELSGDEARDASHEMSNLINRQVRSMHESGFNDADAEGELRALQEELLGSTLHKDYGTQVNSLATRTYQTIRTIGIPGKGRVFHGPNHAREEEIYRQALLDGLHQVPKDERFVSGGGKDFYRIEELAKAAVQQSRGDFGPVDVLAKKFDEKTPDTKQVVQSTPEQNRAKLFTAVRSGGLPIRDDASAEMIAGRYMDKANTPDDVWELEVQRIKDIAGVPEPMSRLGEAYTDTDIEKLSVGEFMQLYNIEDKQLSKSVSEAISNINSIAQEIEDSVDVDAVKAFLGSLLSEVALVDPKTTLGPITPFRSE
jgi:hypothetical protein